MYHPPNFSFDLDATLVVQYYSLSRIAMCRCPFYSKKWTFNAVFSLLSILLFSVVLITNPVILVQVLLSDRRIGSASTNDGVWASGVCFYTSLLFLLFFNGEGSWSSFSLASQGVCVC